MSSSQRKDLGRALCIITGASRGFGRTVARELSRLVKPGSVLILTARSEENLRSLEVELAGSEAGKSGLLVQCVPADLAQMEGLQSVVSASRSAFSEHIDHVILVNNAASLGDVSRFTSSFTDMAEVDSYLSLNVTSCLCLTARLLQALPPRSGLCRSVINITSLCALQPFKSWALYCTGKAAREMMFRVLAAEEPDLRVLSYSPEMQSVARSSTADPDLKKTFSDMFSAGQLLTCEASCAKLMKLLLEDSFTSGAHIDVFDL
ncbi:Sepiapterin reductase [Dissostichus eleginoides]|uniref:Sepiapterin reductase n=1 Tax=Dissostichus eleginoides TaxID=100907 RepID=A0AAD9F0I0_DISEL|nr:Sepiapterin reductase [Dissostichus eleginoides]